MFPLKDENPTQTIPFITVGLITLNIIAFIFQINYLIQGIDISKVFGLRPASFIYEPSRLHFATLFTSIFLHGGITHLLFNMWFLWIFGNNVEDALGHIKYVFFYLITGIGSGIIYLVTSPTSHIPAIGASGAISGVMGAYILLFPHARILTFFPIFFFFRIPAFFFLGVWIIFQFIGGTIGGSGTNEGIAWFAHIGGFIIGMILIMLIPKRKQFRKLRYYN